MHITEAMFILGLFAVVFAVIAVVLWFIKLLEKRIKNIEVDRGHTFEEMRNIRNSNVGLRFRIENLEEKAKIDPNE